jgi:hypothetical protein
LQYIDEACKKIQFFINSHLGNDNEKIPVLVEFTEKGKTAAETAKILEIINENSPKINPDSPPEKECK